jgi:hypothetical protein
MNELRLDSESLLSKWGFNDGDEPDPLLDLLDERGLPYPTRDEWTIVLRRLVRKHLIPALDQAVEVVDMETSHNPIRVTAVDGVDVRALWSESGKSVPLTPEAVAVPIDEVLRALDEVRP